MKVSGNVRDITVTQSGLARALGLTPARVSQLISDEIVKRDEKDASGGVFLFDSVKNYYTTKNAKQEDANFWIERARHEKVKRQLSELKLAKEEGMLYEASVVEAAMTEQLVGLRTHLLGLGMKLAPQLVGKSKGKIAEAIEREIEERLEEISSYDPKLFENENERGTDASDSVGGTGTDQKNNGDGMGGKKSGTASRKRRTRKVADE